MTGLLKKLLFGALVLLGALATPATAQDGAGGLTCPSAGTFAGGVVTRVCWPCFFPILIGPVPVGTTLTGQPEDDVNPVCVCPGRIFGLPTPGLRLGMWQPTHAIEMVRHPFCSPFLGGALSSAGGAGAIARLSLMGGAGTQGASVKGAETSDSGAYYNFHWIMFPVGAALDLMQDSVCVSDLGIDFDIAYISEIDPTWNNEELALFTHPEAVLFTSLPAIGACMADAVAASTVRPIRALTWCAGSWGHGYPFAGFSTPGDAARATSHGAFRALAALHRRGLAHKTYGGAAVCRDHPWPTLPKQQYKLQTFYPVPELVRNHWLGQSTLTWLGGQVSIPGVGEDFVYLVWTWQACCANI